MGKVYKKISGFIIIMMIIICGFWYIEGNTSNYSSNDKDKLVEVNTANRNEKILLVNEKHGLSGNYTPEGLSIPNIPFSNGSYDEEKHVAGTVVKPLEELVNAAREFEILYLLATNRGRVFSAEEIFQKVWKERYYQSNNTVMVHMSRLRDKIEHHMEGNKVIHTIWGVGYKIEK